MKKIIISGCIILAGLALIVFPGCKKKAAAANGEQEKIPVNVVLAAKSDISDIVALTGNIEAINTADVFPKVTGRVEERFVNNGDMVKTGNKLAVLEHSLITAQVKQWAASLEAADQQLNQLEINLVNLGKDLERISSLADSGAVSEQKKDDIETKYNAMQAQKKQVQAQKKQSEAMLEQAVIQEREATIVSPVDGFVAACYLEKGDMAAPSQPAFKIVQIEKVKIIAHLSENDFTRVNTKTPARLKIGNEPEISCAISNISPALDLRTRSAELEIHLDNPEYKLKPGMFAEVELIISTETGRIVIPKDYILVEMGKYFVFKVVDNKIKKQEIQIGIQSKGMVAVMEGISEEDQLITIVGAHLKDGTSVEIIKESAAK
ncbi:MAG: efflux RND transporter periplasmic adaptor subunit [Planctomycetes bacterium]|nr:efflux RND transporter periplasmic adaptor subunit [Planctomycetota bacterium]